MTNSQFPRPDGFMSPTPRPLAWHRTLETHGNACVCGETIKGIPCWSSK